MLCQTPPLASDFVDAADLYRGCPLEAMGMAIRRLRMRGLFSRSRQQSLDDHRVSPVPKEFDSARLSILLSRWRGSCCDF